MSATWRSTPGLTVGEWAVALLSLLVVRAASVLVSLWRAHVGRRERYTEAWFGPRGFASVVYVRLAVRSGIPTGETVFELVALTIVVSMVAHSMSDVPVAKAFDVEEIAALPEEDRPGRGPARHDRDGPPEAKPNEAVRALLSCARCRVG